MRRLSFLLRPGWIALALVAIAFAYLCFTVLAPWQLGKNSSTSRENQQIEASLIGRSGTGDNLSAAAGFIGAGGSVAPGDRDRTVCAGSHRCWPGCG